MDSSEQSPNTENSKEVQREAARPPRRNRSSLSSKGIGRRDSREWALQMLFQIDLTPPETSMEEFFEGFWKLQADVIAESNETDKTRLEEFNKKHSLIYRRFAEKLVLGVWNKRDEIDFKIEDYLTNWTLTRIGNVDRNVLRLAFYELFFCEETPPVVILNEAVDIAKYFSTKESGKFVNGILDRAIKDVSRHNNA